MSHVLFYVSGSIFIHKRRQRETPVWAKKKREKHLASVDFHQAVHLPQVVTFNSTVPSSRLGRSSSRLHLWYLWSKPLSLDLGGGHEEELSWVHDYHIQKVKGPWWVSQILLQDRGCVRAQISSDTPSTTQNKECCFLAPGDRFVFNLFEIYLSLNVVFVVVFIERLHHTRLFNDFCAYFVPKSCPYIGVFSTESQVSP